MRMAVAAAVRHGRGRTRTAVDAAVHVGGIEYNVDVPVSRSVEQIVDDPMPQVVADTVVEQIVGVPGLEFQEGIAKQVVDFTFQAIKDDLVEVTRPLLQDCIQGQLAEQIVVDFAAPPIKGELPETCTTGAQPRERRGADSATPRATDQWKHRVCVSGSASGAHPRARSGKPKCIVGGIQRCLSS